MTTTARASRAVPWSLAAKALRFAFSLATTMIVVRLLSPHDYGVLAIVRTAAAFVAAFAGLGMANAVIRFLPERETLGSGSRSLVRFATLIQLFGWILFLILIFMLRSRIDALYGSPIGTPLLAAVAFLSGNMLFTVLQSSLTSTFRTKRLAALQIPLSILILILSWLALRSGYGVIGVLGAASLPYLAAAVLFGPSMLRVLKGGKSPREGKRILSYGLPLAVVEVFNLITWRQSETLLLGHFHGPEQAGIFDIAYRLPQLLVEFIPETIWPLVLAAFVEVYTRKKEMLGEMIGHYFRILFFLVTPITLFGALYGDLLIETLYGADRAISGNYARIFFLVFHVSFYGTPYSMAIYLLEKTWINLVLAGLFALVNIGLDLILIPRYGLAGAVPPVALAVGISPFLRAWVVRRIHGSIRPPWAFIGKCYLAAAPILLFYPLRSVLAVPIALLVIAVLSVITTVFALRVVRILGPEELIWIRQADLPGAEKIIKWFSKE